MHDIKWIRDNAAAFDAGLARRGLAGEASRLIGLDETRREAIAQLQEAQSRRNAVSKDIGQAMAQKDMARADALKAEVAALKDTTPALEAAEREAIAALDEALASIPNLPKADVPEGADEHGNVIYRTHGTKPEEAGGRLFGINNLKEHFEIGEALGQMDFDAAAKMSGSRFVVLNRGIARLSRALGQFFLDTHTQEHGYDEVMPPLLVRDDAMFGTAQLPKFEDDQFFISLINERDARGYAGALLDFVDTQQLLEMAKKAGNQAEFAFAKWQDCLAPATEDTGPPPGSEVDFWLNQLAKELLAFQKKGLSRLGLIPTAEVPLTNLVRESIIDEDTLPRRYTALTPCFRAEAGSAGRDTRGMLRQHQFDKVELVSITTPEKSAEEHERMLECAENVLKKLGLHFRTMVLCTGDMGFASQKTYDIEVWLPGQKAYREISSCSVCGDFQARRMKAQYRPKDAAKGALPFVHTLNGSGVAVGRALIAVIENYQNADGSITVPDALLPYMGGATRVG